MRPEKNLAEMGVIPKTMIPSRVRLQQVTPAVKVTCNYEKLCSRVPTDPKLAWVTATHAGDGDTGTQQSSLTEVDTGRILHKTPVSRDPNAEILARTYLPAVIVSVSALKVLMDNFGPNYDAPWYVPFAVRTYAREEEGRVTDVQKVIFVNKPLPPQSLSVKEKNEWYHKVATKAFLLHPWTKSKRTLSGGAGGEGRREDSWPEEGRESSDDPFFSSEGISSLETFGTETVSQVDGNLSGSDSDEDGNLVIAERTGTSAEDGGKTEAAKKRRDRSGGSEGSKSQPSTGGRVLRSKRQDVFADVAAASTASEKSDTISKRQTRRGREKPPPKITKEEQSSQDLSKEGEKSPPKEEGKRILRSLRTRNTSGNSSEVVFQSLPETRKRRASGKKSSPIPEKPSTPDATTTGGTDTGSSEQTDLKLEVEGEKGLELFVRKKMSGRNTNDPAGTIVEGEKQNKKCVTGSQDIAVEMSASEKAYEKELGVGEGTLSQVDETFEESAQKDEDGLEALVKKGEKGDNVKDHSGKTNEEDMNKEKRIAGFRDNVAVELSTSEEESEKELEVDEEGSSQVDRTVELSEKEMVVTREDDMKAETEIDPSVVGNKETGEGTREKDAIPATTDATSSATDLVLDGSSAHQRQHHPNDHIQNLVSLLERRRLEKKEYYKKLEKEHAALRKDEESQKGAQQSFLGGIMAAQESMLVRSRREEEEARQRKSAAALRHPARQYRGERVSCFDAGLREADFVPPCEGGNVSYRLWNLWNKAAPPATNLRVVVRCSTHGILRLIRT